MFKPAKDSLLLLEDGSVFYGKAFGAEVDSIGEVVFNTGMVGYLDSMTDPSYAGQILAFTYPLIGNYGVPLYSDRDDYGLPRFFESDSIKVKGIVVQEACREPSHWASKRTLSRWMESEGIPGIEGVDTRALVIRLRDAGVMLGIMAVGGGEREKSGIAELLSRAESYASQNFVKTVSVSKPVVHGHSDEKVVLIDTGTKYGIVRNLLQRGFQVVRVPYNSSYSAVMQYDPAGVVVCNGPGDPQLLTDTAKCVGSLTDSGVPILGICLGEQVVGMSQGAEAFKLKYGHRGQNKPCIDLTTGRGYVTSQNHGYALTEKSMKGTELKPWFRNADDGTIEGVLHSSKPCMAVQFHPEATPGPYDTQFVFDRFADSMRRKATRGVEIRNVRA